MVTKSTSLQMPNMATVLMVQKTIKESDEPLKKMELYKAVPKSMRYQTFVRILEYLENHNQIAYDNEGRIVWIAADNSKLEALLKSGFELSTFSV